MTKVKQFGVPTERKLREQGERKVERLWELIEADFATLKRECKIEHPCKMITLERLRAQFEDLTMLYEALSNTAEKSEN